MENECLCGAKKNTIESARKKCMDNISPSFEVEIAVTWAAGLAHANAEAAMSVVGCHGCVYSVIPLHSHGNARIKTTTEWSNFQNSFQLFPQFRHG